MLSDIGLSRCPHRANVAAQRGVLIVQIIDCRNQTILHFDCCDYTQDPIAGSTSNRDLSSTDEGCRKNGKVAGSVAYPVYP
jgi:hypothetical protein